MIEHEARGGTEGRPGGHDLGFGANGSESDLTRERAEAPTTQA
jgi:hypothetical protein